MPLISGTHRCNNCGKDLFWEYSLPDHWNNTMAFVYTKGSLRPKLLNSSMSEILEIRLICTKCNHANDFTYDNHNYYNKLKLHQKHF